MFEARLCQLDNLAGRDNSRSPPSYGSDCEEEDTGYSQQRGGENINQPRSKGEERGDQYVALSWTHISMSEDNNY